MRPRLPPPRAGGNLPDPVKTGAGAARSDQSLDGAYFFGGLFGGWQDPHGLLFVTYCGFAPASTELKATIAPAIIIDPAAITAVADLNLRGVFSCAIAALVTRSTDRPDIPASNSRARNCATKSCLKFSEIDAKHAGLTAALGRVTSRGRSLRRKMKAAT
jgi:hypothetical protein